MSNDDSGERLRQEWRTLGFYYEFQDTKQQWRIVGSQAGLMRFCTILRAYAADASHAPLSEHEHYGPYAYLKIMTWHEATISPDAISGTLLDFLRLADTVADHIYISPPGKIFTVDAEYAGGNTASLCFAVREPDFDPASSDSLLV